MKTFILRIENKQGQGPYRALSTEIYNESPLINHCKYTGRPIPADDIGINRFPENYEICGFKNSQQLRKWFTFSELQFLKDYGFQIVKKEVKKITAIGEKQVLAIPLKSFIPEDEKIYLELP